MKEENQDKQRRQLIFSILDDLKEQGERINADKVARIGKMGKQTILPYYNEWRFMVTLGEEQELELPEELVTGLKRGMAKWKHQLTEEQRAFEESANQEIDQLKESLQQLSDKNDVLTRRNDELLTQNQQAQSSLEALKLEAQQNTLQLKDLEALLHLEKQQKEQLKAVIGDQKTTHQQAIHNLEKQLDQRHQEQLNHWLSVVDDERRLKQGLEKNIAKLNEKLGELNKFNHELQGRLESKSKAYAQACEERNSLSSGKEKAESAFTLIQQLMVLLHCEQIDILKHVRNLQGDSRELMITHQQYQAERNTNEKLECRIAEMEGRVKRFNSLELELERARGAAEAFEKALSGRPGQKEGVKA